METVALTRTLLFISFLAFASTEVEVKAKPGETVTLPCKAPNNNIITVVEWSRPDLDPECVFLYRDEWIDADSQNPIFKNRVDLQDKQIKDGNVSVSLQNVTADDAGKYECRVVQTTKRRKRAVDHISIINLSVDPPGGDRGHLGIIPPFMCVAAILIAVIIVKKKKKKNSSLTLPSDKESEQMQV